MQYVTALISAVGIFCMGAGLSVYHGIAGLNHPNELQSVGIAGVVLAGSFISESITLVLAIKSIKQSAKDQDMGFLEFVIGGYDPCVNVILLEDFAAVLGVVIAGGSMGLSLHLSSHIPDAVGSIMIGGLLGSMASFMIYTNSAALVGRSIPEEKIKEINEGLEGDIMVRQIMDVKGIDMGNGIVRYTAQQYGLVLDFRDLKNIPAFANFACVLECTQKYF
jgi:zinc transporter 9